MLVTCLVQRSRLGLNCPPPIWTGFDHSRCGASVVAVMPVFGECSVAKKHFFFGCRHVCRACDRRVDVLAVSTAFNCQSDTSDDSAVGTTCQSFLCWGQPLVRSVRKCKSGSQSDPEYYSTLCIPLWDAYIKISRKLFYETRFEKSSWSQVFLGANWARLQRQRCSVLSIDWFMPNKLMMTCSQQVCVDLLA